ncbi:peptidase M23 [Limnochorda pilosa]|uniref:Peptidase M23 n=1 Tax=Limnochorda pilosa TaxID=1555112 RepID=A0A0K2SQP5_LIMPI|nr:peptidase M23 [Limnochorda pilosa]
MPKPTHRARPQGFHLVILGDAARPARQRYLSRTYVHGVALAGLLFFATLAGLGVAVVHQSHQATARQAEVLSLQDERDRLASALAHQEAQFKELALQTRQLSDRMKALEGFAAQVEQIVRANPDVMPQGSRVDLALATPPPRVDLPAGGGLSTNQLADWMRTTLGSVAQGVSTQDRRLSSLRKDLDQKVYRLQHTPSIWPVNGWLSSNFGYRDHPLTGQREHHDGVDIATNRGTPVVAAAAGKVVRSGWIEGYGYAIELDHGFGVRTLYGHNDRLLVKRGQTVAKGERIALVGNTGVSTGPHLHYEVRVNGKPVSPWPYLP